MESGLGEGVALEYKVFCDVIIDKLSEVHIVNTVYE
jgi:hypothetical protein